MGGDGAVRVLGNGLEISIRTPAWGGDPEPLNIARVVDISIRTPAWGVTINRELGTTIILFQFAPRVGGDLPAMPLFTAPPISIHTPAWGVTRGHSSSRRGSLFQFALQQRRRYRHFSKANNGINVQCWNAQFFHISDSDADVLVPAKEIAVRGENIEGIEQFFHSEASSMMPAAAAAADSFLPTS